MDRGEPGAALRNRRRPVPGLITNCLGFACGVGALFLLPSLPPFWPFFLLLPMSAVAAWRLPLLRPLAFAVIGFLWAWIQVCQVLCEPFPEQFARRDVELTGRIVGLPGERGAAFVFCSGSRARAPMVGISVLTGWCA